MVDSGSSSAPVLTLGADEGIPVRANRRTFWLYHDTCFNHYRNTAGAGS